jgi:hypothetical protein
MKNFFTNRKEVRGAAALSKEFRKARVHAQIKRKQRERWGNDIATSIT